MKKLIACAIACITLSTIANAGIITFAPYDSTKTTPSGVPASLGEGYGIDFPPPPPPPPAGPSTPAIFNAGTLYYDPNLVDPSSFTSLAVYTYTPTIFSTSPPTNGTTINAYVGTYTHNPYFNQLYYDSNSYPTTSFTTP